MGSHFSLLHAVTFEAFFFFFADTDFIFFISLQPLHFEDSQLSTFHFHTLLSSFSLQRRHGATAMIRHFRRRAIDLIFHAGCLPPGRWLAEPPMPPQLRRAMIFEAAAAISLRRFSLSIFSKYRRYAFTRRFAASPPPSSTPLARYRLPLSLPRFFAIFHMKLRQLSFFRHCRHFIDTASQLRCRWRICFSLAESLALFSVIALFFSLLRLFSAAAFTISMTFRLRFFTLLPPPPGCRAFFAAVTMWLPAAPLSSRFCFRCFCRYFFIDISLITISIFSS
jgi:hypothetical protein